MPRQYSETIHDDNPLWYKDAIIYEVHVRAFADSDSDGMGDFRGLTARLDYLQDLGVTAIWLLPFYPSPLRDDGYDIADYNAVNPSYGNIQDVRTFIKEAHKRGLRVITELVCNHTSDQHPWFQRARTAKPGSAARNWYVWSDTPERYKEARIIFKDFESSNWTYDPVAEAYYWHRFYSHQPDLNFASAQVRRAIFGAMDFWLKMGVDGLRLDAIPYLYEREGTNCENLSETHDFLKELRARVDEKFVNRMFLAEANQWPEDAVAYFGEGDECHMAFHFPVMPRMFMAIYMEDRFPIIEIMNQTPAIPDNCQWAIFLRNHDELTLEMVTDEERDYMYRVYAQDQQARINLGIRRRLAPLLGNNRRKIELMNGLLFSLPGTPVIYYGDEIGMGDNIYLGDRNGVRTPMQWSADRNAGFSRANPQKLYLPVITDPEYHYETVNVEAQQNNPHSLFWWTKRLIALRKRYKAFGRGTIEFLHPDNRKVLCFVRKYEDEIILVIANLSRFVQAVELDLSEFRNLMPVEIFGRVEFPLVGELPYFITLGPHTFYWFSLEPQKVDGAPGTPGGQLTELPSLVVAGSWERVLQGNARASLERMLPTFVQARRWFGGKSRRIKSITIREVVPLSFGAQTAYLTMLGVDYIEGNPETYMLAMAFATGDRAAQLVQDLRPAVISRLTVRDAGLEGVVYDPIVEREFNRALLDMVVNRRRLRGQEGDVIGAPARTLRGLLGGNGTSLEPAGVKAEQSNSSIIYGNRLILKLFRKLDTGVNPDLEIGRFLTERNSFANTPPVAGYIEYQRSKGEPISLGILQGFVLNEGDAWSYTRDTLGSYFDRALTAETAFDALDVSTPMLLALTRIDPPEIARELIGGYLESARLLGQRTAEMHLVLASSQSDPAFAPEAFTTLYQRSLYQSIRNQTVQIFQALRKNLKRLPADVQAETAQILEQEAAISERLRTLIDHKIQALRIRHHGDYHLGQVLFTGSDFMIIDFEGEPARALTERRIKRSPLRDVAGMLRSFHYAASSVLFGEIAGVVLKPDNAGQLDALARFWYCWSSAMFLKGYLDTAGNAAFLPQDHHELQVLLDAFLFEKAVYELGYELNNRPTWLVIPLRGITQLLEPQTA